PTTGRFDAHTLFTTTNDVWGVDAASDGSIYVNLIDRPVTVVRLSLEGKAESIAKFPLLEGTAILMLPHGRAVVPPRASGRTRLMVAEKGKDPMPLVDTVEETASPMTTIGSREIAFAIGPSPRQTIAIANIESGRITRRIAVAQGAIESMAYSSEGRTLF